MNRNFVVILTMFISANFLSDFSVLAQDNLKKSIKAECPFDPYYVVLFSLGKDGYGSEVIEDGGHGATDKKNRTVWTKFYSEESYTLKPGETTPPIYAECYEGDKKIKIDIPRDAMRCVQEPNLRKGRKIKKNGKFWCD